MSDLEFILADMSMKTNVNESVQLGELIQASTVNSVAQEYGKARDLGLKHALFYVLLGARMPAVLVETGFVSNRQEERKLGTKKFQDSLAEGIVKGIRRYVEQKQASYAPN